MKLRMIESDYQDLPDQDEFKDPVLGYCPLCGMTNLADYSFLFTHCENCDAGFCPNCKPGGDSWKKVDLADPKYIAILAKFETARKTLNHWKDMLIILKCPSCPDAIDNV